MKCDRRRYHDELAVIFLAVCVVTGSVCCATEDRRDTRQPSTDNDDMLSRFIDELVEITPGVEPFPESTTTDNGVLRPAAAFRISRYETTQELYAAVMNGNPSRWKGPRNSVETVSADDVRRFCSRLTAILRRRELISEAEVVRLPSEVEWEYCCRAGSAQAYCFGAADETSAQLDQYAWHTGNAAGNDPAVGVLAPNAFGLYDMHGYLWELVETSTESEKTAAPVTQAMGGSWRDPADLLRSDSRVPLLNYAHSDAVGFRCVVSSAPVEVKIPADR